ncbi:MULTISPECIES: ATP-binding protein [Streptomyces]|uniref:ATP-binding protein n=1 Tax=Streptomyces decoyicus TaxID=249567 RepID=A0ABZ1FC01_9ACTN|nr:MULTISPECIES: ATP-binding protein [Streptomyces]MCL7492113.1 ATP-binding protein [Streptomyces sp. MCA2]WSB67790.1 ATP-binding protein [Streptomyces decoyicus]
MPSGPPAEPPEELTSPLAYEGVWRFTAPALEASVPQARHAVRDLLDEQRVPVAAEIMDGLLLIVSELVTNAVRHAALLSPQIAVQVTIGANWLRVAVEDNHPYRPKALEAEQGDVGGRGLWLVKTLTAEAGGKCDVENTRSGGKAIWAELPLTPLATSPPTVL